MDISSLFKDSKFRLLLLILGVVVVVGGIGYYYYANVLSVPVSQEVPKRSTAPPLPSFSDTITQILSTLTFKETVYTYVNIPLGRSNPFIPVITIPERGSTSISISTSQESQSQASIKKEISTPIKTVPKSSFASSFKVTGIIKYGNAYYATIEENDRGYVVKYIPGAKKDVIKGDIYVENIDFDKKIVTLRKGQEVANLKLGGE